MPDIEALGRSSSRSSSPTSRASADGDRDASDPAGRRADGAARARSGRRGPGVLGWLTTTDHKRIGLLYFWTTLVFFGAGGVEALLMRTQLASPNDHVVSPSTYDELFTMHGITMIFFFIIPMTTGAFGNYLLPLMIGARDMAFPRMNALSYWIFLASGIFLYSSLVARRRPRTPAGSTTSRSRAARFDPGRNDRLLLPRDHLQRRSPRR